MRKLIRLFVLAVGALLSASCVTSDRFLAEDAGPPDPRSHEEMRKRLVESQTLGSSYEFAVTGHRITRGAGTVVATRSYRRGIPLLTDQGGFEKLTVFLPGEVASSSRVRIGDRDGVIAFYSKGSSAFPGSSGCIGYAKAGTLEVDGASTNGAVHVTMDLDFDLYSPQGWAGDCGEMRLHTEGAFPRRAVSSLTPWEGGGGAEIHDESYR